jgi:hypothetical protein
VICAQEREEFILRTEGAPWNARQIFHFSNVVGLVGAILINFTVLTFFFRSTNWITLMIAAKTFARLGIEPGPSGLTELLIIFIEVGITFYIGVTLS